MEPTREQERVILRIINCCIAVIVVLACISLPFSFRFGCGFLVAGFGFALLLNSYFNIRYYRHGLGGRVSLDKNPNAYWALIFVLSAIGVGFIGAGVAAFFLLEK